MTDEQRWQDAVVKAFNEGENRYRQTVLSQGPLPGYPVIKRDPAPLAALPEKP